MNEPFIKVFIGILFSVLLLAVVFFSYFASTSHLVEASKAHLVLEHIELSAEGGGRIIESFVKEGSFVTHGSLLFRLDDGSLQTKKCEVISSLKYAQDQLGLAKMKLNHFMELYLETKRDAAIGLTNEETLKKVLYELEEAKIGMEAAASLVEWKQCKLKTLEEEIANKRVLAPLDGIVGEILVTRGAVVTSGQPFLVLYQPKEAFIYATIRERDVADLQLGAEATIFIPAYPHLRCKGYLSFISPEVSNEKEVSIKISLEAPNEVLQSNTSVNVLINKLK